jgi:rare lipoprotein A (peptidoglycan hydrolase)
VKNTANGKVIDCFVNDYGPTLETGREIDLSSYAFSQLAPLSRGLINVEVYVKDK